MTPDKFREEVINDYLEKKANGTLPEGLDCPSPGDLKDFCTLLLAKGLSKEDIYVFKKFFSPFNEEVDLDKAIRQFDSEKLKPLQYFLIGKTKSPKENLVKLSAVLIDFKPRPYSEWKKIREAEAKGDLIEPTIEAGPAPSASDTIEEGPETDMTEEKPEDKTGSAGKNTDQEEEIAVKTTWFKHNLSILAAFMIVLTGIGSYLFIDRAREDERCMVWSGYEYQHISCSAKVVQAPIVPFNDSLYQRMTRIKDPYILTKNDIGRIWYAKIDQDSAEFFISPGSHPLNENKVLKPLTEYILKKYVTDKKE